MTDLQPTTVPGFRADQLEGFRIGVTSDRRAEDLIDALERRGATVVHAPTLRIAHSQHDDQLITDTREVIARRPDVLLATTSYGIRRWFEVSDAAGLGEALVDALGETAILVRGPKARGAIRAAGLNDVGMSDEETTASLVTRAIALFPEPKTVAVQLHGYTDEKQLQRLRRAGHTVLTVAPYRWLKPDENDERVHRLLDLIVTSQLDAVTFTSAPAVDALFGAAQFLGCYDEVIDAFRHEVLAAAVGPVTAAPLIAVGIEPIQPDRYRMGALIRLVCEHLETHAISTVDTRHGRVSLRGCVVERDGSRTALPPAALALFRTLMAAKGAVVPRANLAAGLPGAVDDHALEVALSRLRQLLAVPGLVQTVIKRGYRIDV
ncbi:uroporphyrinogen-III synthase [Mycetocola zhujimingii]|uniref:Uroporphyrinogen-III synthase n=1 Tax=Mycetocola zhujimingii TaxID=2079792 RepID=A0A2U1THG1_9MICO|nr:uroporphyrinogen-III synthase [Mycetocola zhujimingii]PWC08280.1 uroporphyrinogen-III synthase [Mycetocola zhujimingii]